MDDWHLLPANRACIVLTHGRLNEQLGLNDTSCAANRQEQLSAADH